MVVYGKLRDIALKIIFEFRMPSSRKIQVNELRWTLTINNKKQFLYAKKID